MKKFWNWIRNEEGERVLRLEGPIDEDDFWGDEEKEACLIQSTSRCFWADLSCG